jgi:8-oxo-dGTP diphosphatase
MITLAAYKETMKHALKPRTVVFLLRADEVLLGLKQRGFGAGYYVGIGGKVEEAKDRTSHDQAMLAVITQGAIREVEEEIGVQVAPEQLQPRGVIRFYFPHVSNESWNLEAFIFVTRTWQGEPIPKADAAGVVEIVPQWFKTNALPFAQMWDDARYWLPAILAGKSIEAEFIIDADMQVNDSLIKER